MYKRGWGGHAFDATGLLAHRRNRKVLGCKDAGIAEPEHGQVLVFLLLCAALPCATPPAKRP